jgi:outer membrane protein assembly factor BamA
LRVGTVYANSSDSLYQLDTTYLAKGKQEIITMSLYLDYAYDSRNSKSYPLKGNYLKGFVWKRGLGILSHDVDYFFYGIDFHFYQKIGRKFYVAEMVKASKSSSEDISYYFKQNLTSGKFDFIRGYDYYALRGDDMYYVRANLKYELVKPSIKKAKEGSEDSKFKNLQYAFYLNFFSDWAYMKDEFTVNNPYNNRGLYSWGLGLDFVTYYDLVIRFEYAFTSIGTNGFYFGFGMPI